MTVEIINADVMEALKSLPDESIHCVVTSPPYWGLRDYGTDYWEGGDASCTHKQGRNGSGRADGIVDERGQRNRDGAVATTRTVCKCGARKIVRQLGLEPSLGEHISRIVEVFREVRRVMRKDATLWFNYGDCYATSSNGRSAADTKATGNDDRTFRDKPFSTIGGVLKSKDLCMMPHRIAIALQEDGWWVRSDIVWAKPNPMPESISDRPTKAHEYIFLLTKNDKYYYDAEAIKEPVAVADWNDGSRIYGGANKAGANARQQRITGRVAKGNAKTFRGGGAYTNNQSFDNDGDVLRDSHGNAPNESGLRNKRSVWTIATQPFPEAHFATFPLELPELCIKAGCPVGGTVLDPFGGSGTTGLVADRLQRNAILIELNSDYAAMARRRIDADRGGLLDMMETSGERTLV